MFEILLKRKHFFYENGFSFYYYLIKVENKTDETFVVNFYLGEEKDEEKDEDITSHSSVGASSSQSQLDCLSRLESAIDEMFIASAHVMTLSRC